MPATRVWPRLAAVMLWTATLAASFAPAAEIADFSLIQVSDMHLSPWPDGAGDPFETDRSTDTLRWVCREAAQPQELTPLNLTVPRPRFIVATGDLTEFGVIGRTWSNLERSFAGLEVPVYFVCGNHDNTWTSMLHIMWKLYGNDHYSFDEAGCHFVVINTATPQEPVPVIEQRTLTWLAGDLEKVPRGTPIFLFCHHPLHSTEFSQPIEPLGLLEVLRGHNVVLLAIGHGHQVAAHRLGPLDSVMGGSTFGPNTGYNIIAVRDGMLHVVYRFREEGKPMRVQLSKPIRSPRPADLTWIEPFAWDTARDDRLTARLRIEGAAAERVTASIDGLESHTVVCAAEGQGVYACTLPLTGLLPGRHALVATARVGDRDLHRLYPLHLPGGEEGPRVSRLHSPAGFKAGAVSGPSGLLAANTAGEILLIDRAGRNPPRCIFRAAAPILHAPALDDDTLYVGSADRKLRALGLDGSLKWEKELPGNAFGTPALDREHLYVGDLEGYVHALRRDDGRTAWSKKHAVFSIEMPLLLHDGTLYFGAWDGHVYAARTADGTLVWKTGGPAGHGDPRKKNRYYSPADCPGVIIGDRLFFCDRAYQLGSYALADGTYLGDIAGEISAIGPTADGRGFYARGLNGGLRRYDGRGQIVWSADVEAGRFPCPPVEERGRVYVCSNRGTLSVLHAADGRLLWQYQVTPRLSVMAPVTAGCVLGMDGSITLLPVNP